MTPHELLAAARDVLAATPPAWPQAVALLARQALEGAVDELWMALSLDMRDASMHGQLLCLPRYLDDAAGLAADTWTDLSRVCHHHPYELAPTVQELSAR